jgi:hypothetical protein
VPFPFSFVLYSNSRNALEVENIQHQEAAAVHQYDVPADEEVGGTRGRRRQTHFQFSRARDHLFLQPWREGSAYAELPFQSRRQPIALGEPGREVIALLAIPSAHFVAVVVAVVVPVAITVLILAVVFRLTLAMTVSVAVLVGRQRRAAECEHRHRAGLEPPFQSHEASIL